MDKYIIDFLYIQPVIPMRCMYTGASRKEGMGHSSRKDTGQHKLDIIFTFPKRRGGGGQFNKRSRQDMSVCVLPVPVDRPKIARIHHTDLQTVTQNVLVLYV